MILFLALVRFEVVVRTWNLRNESLPEGSVPNLQQVELQIILMNELKSQNHPLKGIHGRFRCFSTDFFFPKTKKTDLIPFKSKLILGKENRLGQKTN